MKRPNHCYTAYIEWPSGDRETIYVLAADLWEARYADLRMLASGCLPGAKVDRGERDDD